MTNDESNKEQTIISWDNVPLNSNKVGHLEILCVKLCKNAAWAEHWQMEQCPDMTENLLTAMLSLNTTTAVFKRN